MSFAKLSGDGDLTSRSESLAMQVSNHPVSVGSSGLYRHERPIVLSFSASIWFAFDEMPLKSRWTAAAKLTDEDDADNSN